MSTPLPKSSFLEFFLRSLMGVTNNRSFETKDILYHPSVLSLIRNDDDCKNVVQSLGDLLHQQAALTKFRRRRAEAREAAYARLGRQKAAQSKHDASCKAEWQQVTEAQKWEDDLRALKREVEEHGRRLRDGSFDYGKANYDRLRHNWEHQQREFDHEQERAFDRKRERDRRYDQQMERDVDRLRENMRWERLYGSPAYLDAARPNHRQGPLQPPLYTPYNNREWFPAVPGICVNPWISIGRSGDHLDELAREDLVGDALRFGRPTRKSRRQFGREAMPYPTDQYPGNEQPFVGADIDLDLDPNMMPRDTGDVDGGLAGRHGRRQRSYDRRQPAGPGGGGQPNAGMNADIFDDGNDEPMFSNPRRRRGPLFGGGDPFRGGGGADFMPPGGEGFGVSPPHRRRSKRQQADAFRPGEGGDDTRGASPKGSSPNRAEDKNTKKGGHRANDSFHVEYEEPDDNFFGDEDNRD